MKLYIDEGKSPSPPMRLNLAD